MTNEEITLAVADILGEVADAEPAEIRPDSVFGTDVDVDSLLMVEIVVAIEEHFSIKLPEENLKDMKTVGDLVNLIQDRLIAA